jgi:hypothetical protein
MPSTWQTVRVFISSTFRDMHAERDHLIKVTFPALREKLLPFRVELYDIDLRWGITEDEAKNEKVIGLCLEQVDECRPFFLAFIGHRYGWVPAQVPPETQQRFPFVQQLPGVSVTELELRHAVTPHPNGNHTLILLRKEEAVASIPEAKTGLPGIRPAPATKARRAQAGTRSRPVPREVVLCRLGPEALRPRQPHRGEADATGRVRQTGRGMAVERDQPATATPGHPR